MTNSSRRPRRPAAPPPIQRLSVSALRPSCATRLTSACGLFAARSLMRETCPDVVRTGPKGTRGPDGSGVLRGVGPPSMTESETLYYDRRAAEYDDWYLGAGLFAERVRPGWHEELTALRWVLRCLPI